MPNTNTWSELIHELSKTLKKHKVVFPTPSIELTDTLGDKIWINQIGASWSGQWGLFGRVENRNGMFIFTENDIQRKDYPIILEAAKKRAKEISASR